MSRRHRILVIEDEPLLLRVLARVLSVHGFEVATADNGAEAIALLQREGPEIALVVSDVRMPVMDGPTLLRTLASDGGSPPPFVFLTGHTEYSDEQLLALGARAVLGKPVSSDALLRTLRECLAA